MLPFGGKVRLVLLALLLVIAALVGAFMLGILGLPTVESVENRFLEVNETGTVIGTELTVHNPYPISASLGGVSVNYTVELNEVRLAQGTKQGINITSGNGTLRFRTVLANERIPPWWVSHIRNGETSTLRVNATVRSATLGRSVSIQPVERPVETDLLSSFNSTEPRPVNANAALVEDPVLYINETSAWWGEVTAEETPLRTAFVVYNPKSVPYAITEIGYTIRMNDIVVGEGSTSEIYTLPPRTERTVQATTAIDNPTLDEWWVSHLQRNQVTRLSVDFYAVVELPGGQRVRIPLDSVDYEETIETDIFGTKPEAPANQSDAAHEGGSTPTPSTTDTPTSSSTPTDTPTAGDQQQSPTATPADTPTPTPTDGLPVPL